MSDDAITDPAEMFRELTRRRNRFVRQSFMIHGPVNVTTSTDPGPEKGDAEEIAKACLEFCRPTSGEGFDPRQYIGGYIRKLAIARVESQMAILASAAENRAKEILAEVEKMRRETESALVGLGKAAP